MAEKIHAHAYRVSVAKRDKTSWQDNTETEFQETGREGAGLIKFKECRQIWHAVLSTQPYITVSTLPRNKAESPASS